MKQIPNIRKSDFGGKTHCNTFGYPDHAYHQRCLLIGLPVDDVITTTANPMRELCVAIWFTPSLDKGSVYYGWKSMMIIMVYINSRPSCMAYREQGRLKN